MGLSGWLAGAAARGAHVLVVEVPGWWSTRVALEQALGRRGWVPALSPADADALVVCGDPGERLAEAVDAVWEQMPGPRARSEVRAPEAADGALDEVRSVLLDGGWQERDAAGRTSVPDRGEAEGETEMAPAGIPLAGGADDRDGLEMDVLHVPLGPVLPAWPAGLVLRTTLAGDVLTEAHVEVLGPAAPPGRPRRSSRSGYAARRCDGAARVLAVAGWDAAASDARRVRDDLLVDGDPEAAERRLERLRSRVERSRLLRWSLRGLGVLDADALAEHRLPAGAGGDVRDRLLAQLASGRDALRGVPTPQSRDVARAVLAVLPPLVTGLDLATARLVVASLDPDTATVAREAVRA